MKNSKLFYVYLLLAGFGLAATWYFNIMYMQAGGSFAPGPFWANAFANYLTASLTLDVYVAALAFSVWVVPESRRTGIRWPAIYVMLTFLGALAFAFPLFLAVRERALQARRLQALNDGVSPDASNVQVLSDQ
jgi:hypothetical protein